MCLLSSSVTPCMFLVVSGSGPPGLALPDDLFFLRLRKASLHVCSLRTALRLPSLRTALLSRHNQKCYISAWSLKSPRVITMATLSQPKNTDLIGPILVWPWCVSHDCVRILVITSLNCVQFCPDAQFVVTLTVFSDLFNDSPQLQFHKLLFCQFDPRL